MNILVSQNRVTIIDSSFIVIALWKVGSNTFKLNILMFLNTDFLLNCINSYCKHLENNHYQM